MNSQEVKIPSTKGSLAASVHYPEVETRKLAILCPGFLDSKDYKGMTGLSNVLSKRGYTVVDLTQLVFGGARATFLNTI